MDFKNYKKAYSYKTDWELKNSIIVFRIITSKTLVKAGSILVKLALRFGIPLRLFTTKIFNHFCGGENLNKVIELSERLVKFNVKTLPDYSVEAESGSRYYNKLIEEIHKSIELSSKNKNFPFAVFKPTGLVEPEYLKNNYPNDLIQIKDFKKRLNEILAFAYAKKVSVLIDAEDYMYQQRIDDILIEFMKLYNKEFPVVFTTLQMYRKDRLNYLQNLYEESVKNDFILGIKFVRGAYMEKERERAIAGNYPDPIYKTKQETDNAFDEAIKFSIQHIDRIYVFCGTHNEKSCLNLVRLIEDYKLEKSDKRIWFSQLYGMRDNISFNLAAEGYNIAKYVPYGPVNNVIPYLLRRAEENSSAAEQSITELKMLKEVLKIRKDMLK